MAGPGKSYRKGITLMELMEMFPDNKAAEEWFEMVRWGEAGKPTYCPKCGCTDRIGTTASRKPMPYRCGPLLVRWGGSAWHLGGAMDTDKQGKADGWFVKLSI